MSIELELRETYAERKNEAELARLWLLQTLAEDDDSYSKRCVEICFHKEWLQVRILG